MWLRAILAGKRRPSRSGSKQGICLIQIRWVWVLLPMFLILKSFYEQGGATRGLNVYLRGTQAGDNPQEAELWFSAINRAEQAWGGVLPTEQTGIPTNGDPVAIGTTIQANTVYHAVMVLNGDDSDPDSFEGTLTGYLNGEQFGQASGIHLLYNHSDDVAFGARNEEAVSG